VLSLGLYAVIRLDAFNYGGVRFGLQIVDASGRVRLGLFAPGIFSVRRTRKFLALIAHPAVSDSGQLHRQVPVTTHLLPQLAPELHVSSVTPLLGAETARFFPSARRGNIRAAPVSFKETLLGSPVNPSRDRWHFLP